MFYDPRTEVSNLPHSPVNSGCVPRPIGWISTISRDGVHNLAPFSQFMNVTFDPPTVLFVSCGSPQTDTAENAVATGEFVWNMATYDQRDQVVKSATAYPPEIDEFEALGIEWEPAKLVTPRRVKASPMHFECVVSQTIDFPGGIPQAGGRIVIGQVIGIHIADDAITADGRVDTLKLRPLARLGYLDYTSVESRFELRVPGYDTLFHNPETLHAALTDD
jgi:flavin reductase (DIM6/NTAB) family NADH-FMN oxidoreductase RutF